MGEKEKEDSEEEEDLEEEENLKEDLEEEEHSEGSNSSESLKNSGDVNKLAYPWDLEDRDSDEPNYLLDLEYKSWEY